MSSSKDFQIVISALERKLGKNIDNIDILLKFLKAEYPTSKDLAIRIRKAYEKAGKSGGLEREEEVKLAFEINQL